MKAIIFDLDGTLINTIDDIADAMNAVLKKNNYPMHSVNAYKNFVGNGLGALVKDALPAIEFSSEVLQAYTDEMKAEYSKCYMDKTRPYDEIPELLGQLNALPVSICILSNKPHHYTVELVNSVFSEIRFQHIAGQKPEIPRKPDPAGALIIADQLKIRPEEILFIGDSDVDMHTAVNAKMLAGAVTWGYRSKEVLLQSGAEFIFEKPAEILGHIKEHVK